MKQTDYEFLIKDGDIYPTIGFCPFCGMPGWITGDDEWCEHYIGTSNGYSAAGPLAVSVFPRFNDLEISKKWLQKKEGLQGLSREELEKQVGKIPEDIKKCAIDSIENDWMPSAFLDLYGKYKYQECTSDGAGWTDFCVSFFVEDWEELILFFKNNLERIIYYSTNQKT